MINATGYRFVKAGDDGLRRFLKPIVSANRWMVYRWPWERKVRITHPNKVNPESLDRFKVRRHEFHHVQDFTPWWGPWLCIALAVLFPFPLLFSGRWFLERRPYRDEIDLGWNTVDKVVDTLGGFKYGWAWPKAWMRRWLESHEKDKDGNLLV